jgi:hypothetical protein
MEHLQILHQYAPELHFDLVVIDRSATGRNELKNHLSTLGSEFFEADLRSSASAIHHDAKKLGHLFAHIENEILVG